MSTTALDPEHEAIALLDATWARGLPTIPLPVDPNAIAAELGIKVYIAGLDEGVSGVLRQASGRAAEIYLQSSDSPTRQRFTCAHELGHYVTRARAGDDDWEYVEHRALLASQGTNQDEIFANKFAANLLMPRAAIAEAVRGGTLSEAVLTAKFGVSSDAMNFRLVNLGMK
jgi:predicted transcriptional regulator